MLSLVRQNSNVTFEIGEDTLPCVVFLWPASVHRTKKNKLADFLGNIKDWERREGEARNIAHKGAQAGVLRQLFGVFQSHSRDSVS